MMYKNILNIQTKDYNGKYKLANKLHPSWSKKTKEAFAFSAMFAERGFNPTEINDLFDIPVRITDVKNYQYRLEMFALRKEIEQGIFRYYIKDDSLVEFFKNVEVKPKEVISLLNTELMALENKVMLIGIISTVFSCTLCCVEFQGEGRMKHLVTVISDEMNYTFCIEDFDKSKSNDVWVFNLVINFLFYINAFPDCVVDGVPNGVKQTDKAVTINTSNKVVSHTTVEHGFVRPHFRSGYFRHLNSDYFVNCKGQVRFIASTMVKGKAKTVLSKENV